ncbi:MAG: hypothetical protein LBR13_03120 [Dysgonamonadaceae bacterium]|jgi:hypothetical protein|nr:hypothetical protein [Dysgonamonadaceae bacterium]
MAAQNTKKLNRPIIVTIRYVATGEPGWEHKDNTWYYNGTKTDETPFKYVIREKHREISIKNGVEYRNCYKTTITVTSTYKTPEEGWLWKDDTWYYNDKKTDKTPEHFYLSKTEHRHQESIDCDEEINFDAEDFDLP